MRKKMTGMACLLTLALCSAACAAVTSAATTPDYATRVCVNRAVLIIPQPQTSAPRVTSLACRRKPAPTPHYAARVCRKRPPSIAPHKNKASAVVHHVYYAHLSRAHRAYIHALLHDAAAGRAKPPHGKALWLPQMLALTYNTNPQILSARAALRATDETYARAASGLRPSLTGSASDQVGTQTDKSSGTVMNSPKTLSLAISQPIFSGGTTLSEMSAAKKRILAQRATVQATTQKVLLHALTAFMNVRRDRWIARLTANNEAVLVHQLKSTRERLRLGAVTVTDLQQAETRLSGAIAERTAADARLQDSIADFENVVGIVPPRLRMHRIDIKLPSSLHAAIARAHKNSPDIAIARFSLEAAHEDRKAAAGNEWPQISLTGQVGRTYDAPVLLPSRQADSASVMVTATIPFYEGGKTDSEVRQAQEIEQQKNMDLYSTERSVRLSVIKAWESLASAKKDVSVRRMQAYSAREARGGVKTEAKFGMRTTLDILNAEQEYLNAEVAYASVIHDRDVAIYTLLDAMGKLTPQTLHIKNIYDPAAHFARVHNRWFGTDVRDHHMPSAKSDL